MNAIPVCRASNWHRTERALTFAALSVWRHGMSAHGLGIDLGPPYIGRMYENHTQFCPGCVRAAQRDRDATTAKRTDA
jgi:hypothetical protein